MIPWVSMEDCWEQVKFIWNESCMEVLMKKEHKHKAWIKPKTFKKWGRKYREADFNNSRTKAAKIRA